LHFFTRAEYRYASGGLNLVEPSNCLLATAWPAFEEQIRERFEKWRSTRTATHKNEDFLVETIAAAASSTFAIMPSPAKPTLLRRLPADFGPPASAGFPGAAREQDPVRTGDPERYTRHEGGIASRALGNAVHKLLEESARLRETNDWTATGAALSQMLPRIKAQLRASGITQADVNSIAARALEIVRQATKDPLGQWILSPHAEAASEAAWTGIVGDALRSVRVDRVFRAGIGPLSEGKDAWWIIDFKTAHPDNLYPLLALPALRSLFAPQLEAYAVILRQLHREKLPIRAGLYYPRISMFDWWAVDARSQA
jgi:hypothetical protein